MGARGEPRRGEAQAAVGPTVLERRYRLPVEVHVYVGFGQRASTVRNGGLNRGPGAADVADGTHGRDGNASRTAAACAPLGTGSRPRVGSTRSPTPSRPAHTHSLLFRSRQMISYLTLSNRLPAIRTTRNPGLLPLSVERKLRWPRKLIGLSSQSSCQTRSRIPGIVRMRLHILHLGGVLMLRNPDHAP